MHLVAAREAGGSVTAKVVNPSTRGQISESNVVVKKTQWGSAVTFDDGRTPEQESPTPAQGLLNSSSTRWTTCPAARSTSTLSDVPALKLLPSIP